MAAGESNLFLCLSTHIQCLAMMPSHHTLLTVEPAVPQNGRPPIYKGMWSCPAQY